ncbi:MULTISPECIES: DUF2905 domain-containing protein [Hymenobacter]|jgi:Protein of unknown function (DUF2905)|uniref:DUF2905 domain-containing protein n=1 Tax=Hymenobacter metallilatus TaxID=2493666 RepID=A0A428JCF4_9BACT|nr:DUF2905 domain-containing protein [Hymenobacter metallilatus]RSK29564.1 DUF2905 domain-containing protein [Hymenobacter metallilatus]
MPPHLGKTLFLLGLGLMVLGALLWLGGGNLLGWFGRLPGDVRVERPGFRLYVPWVSMLLVSAGLSALLWLVRKLGG